MRKWILAILVIALLGGGYYLYTRYQGVQEARAAFDQVKTITIEEGNLTSTIDATGVVRSKQNATLLWETSGTVEEVNVDVGDRVQSGDVLATLVGTCSASERNHGPGRPGKRSKPRWMICIPIRRNPPPRR